MCDVKRVHFSGNPTSKNAQKIFAKAIITAGESNLQIVDYPEEADGIIVIVLPGDEIAALGVVKSYLQLCLYDNSKACICVMFDSETALSYELDCLIADNDLTEVEYGENDKKTIKGVKDFLETI